MQLPLLDSFARLCSLSLLVRFSAKYHAPQVLRLPRITPQDMQRHTRARVAEFRRLNHVRGPEANSKSFTTIKSEGHRLALPAGGGLKLNIDQLEQKMSQQYFSLLRVVMKTYNDVDAAEQKFMSEVNQIWSQDFLDIVRQVNTAEKYALRCNARVDLARALCSTNAINEVD